MSECKDPPIYDPQRILLDGAVVHQSRHRVPEWEQEIVVDLVHAKGSFARRVKTFGHSFNEMVCASVAGVDKEGRIVPSVLDFVSNAKNSIDIRRHLLASWAAPFGVRPMIYDGKELYPGSQIVRRTGLWALLHNEKMDAYVRVVEIPSYVEKRGGTLYKVLCAKQAGMEYDGAPVPSIDDYLRHPLSDAEKAAPFSFVPDMTSHGFRAEIHLYRTKG